MLEKTAILFNGPPGSGKDTAAIHAYNRLEKSYSKGALIPWRPKRMSFATPLKSATHALYGVPFSAEYYEKEFGWDWKNKPQPEFFGEIPREVYIALSEEFAKKRAGGVEHFGRVAARSIQLERDANIFIFSDSGFSEEAVPVISKLGVDRVFVAEFERSGYSFAGDSRSYIGADLLSRFPKLTVTRIPNHQGKDLLRTLVHATLEVWLKLEPRG